MTVITTSARAYVNFNRWVADCPTNCGNAVALTPGQVAFYCAGAGGCEHISSVEWPENAQAIWAVLQERPLPKTRNWFPNGHTLALKAGCPHGQSVEQLRKEAQENGVG